MREIEEIDTGAVSVGVPSLSIERPAVYVVATPLGNLADIGQRAVAILGQVDCILCEDTRHSRPLLDHYAITTRTLALHEHNERQVAAGFIQRLQELGESCALISDAGTPLISDPGYVLVRSAAEAGVQVIAVPGPCALIAALSIAGLPTDRFVFEGFLPSAAGARANRLERLAGETRTMIFYEAPHRLMASVGSMVTAFGGTRDAVVVRELSKRFETVYRAPLGQLEAMLSADPHAARGEQVILIAGAPALDEAQADIDRMLEVVFRHTDRKTAIRIVSALTSVGRNALYQRLLELDGD